MLGIKPRASSFKTCSLTLQAISMDQWVWMVYKQSLVPGMLSGKGKYILSHQTSSSRKMQAALWSTGPRAQVVGA